MSKLQEDAMEIEEDQQQQQMRRNDQMETEMEIEENKTLPKLPMESSPYLKYSDLEEYKRQGYGVDAHLSPRAYQAIASAAASAKDAIGGIGASANEIAGIDRKLK